VPTLTGAVERIVFRSDDERFVVARLKVEQAAGLPGWESATTIVGPLLGLREGQHVRVGGQFGRHPRHGEHLRVDWFEEQLPATAQGIERFLGSGLLKGVGPKTAEKIVSAFGEETIEVLDKQPERLKDVPNLSRAMARKVLAGWSEHRHVGELMMFLRSHDVPAYLAASLRDQYGDRCLTVIRENPYQLVHDVEGVGFKTADSIATKLGLDVHASARLEAGLRYLVEEAAREGHVFLPPQQLLTAAVRLLDAPPDLIEPALLEASRRGLLVIDGDAVYLPALLRAENNVASRLAKLQRAPSFLAPDVIAHLVKEPLETAIAQLGVSLTDNQRQAVEMAMSDKVSVLTGGPGTGKTMCLHALITALDAEGVPFALVAPTGRAAKRMSAATGRAASTIHRWLGFQPTTGGFLHNERDPLPECVMVVDEVSMLDIVLFSHLLAAVPESAHLLLVGDSDQLPSVGPGNVLSDLLASQKIPAVTLDQLFRQAEGSQIAVAAQQIRHGQIPSPSPGQDGDLYFVRVASAEKARDLISELVCERIPRRFGLDPMAEIQVLTPQNRGPAGVGALNETLQGRLNASARSGPSLTHGHAKFHAGDKVMQLRNNYDKDTYNGDIGVVGSVDEEAGALSVHFAEIAAAPTDVRYETNELGDLALAYAVSVHKSQGSEFPCIVVPILMAHYPMLQRNLLYTALTRAKRLCVLLFEPRALEMAVRGVRQDRRNTSLSVRLIAALESPELFVPMDSDPLAD
jgi:exodeoxyribonuclease V alpha subunit